MKRIPVAVCVISSLSIAGRQTAIGQSHRVTCKGLSGSPRRWGNVESLPHASPQEVRRFWARLGVHIPSPHGYRTFAIRIKYSAEDEADRSGVLSYPDLGMARFSWGLKILPVLREKREYRQSSQKCEDTAPCLRNFHCKSATGLSPQRWHTLCDDRTQNSSLIYKRCESCRSSKNSRVL